MFIKYQHVPRNNRRKGKKSAVWGAGGPSSGPRTDLPVCRDWCSPMSAGTSPGRRKMQLVLMVDSVTPVQDLSCLQDPGCRSSVAHDTRRFRFSQFSLCFSCSYIKYPRLPSGPIVCLWAGALLHPAQVAHLCNSTTVTLRAQEGRGCTLGMRTKEERGMRL